ncbi:glycosyltransferase family 39 protein [candidate division FCPU426 bacterium]|nr:glycosyltransferase family 39 protein [candidate division FCPU426 bacterium]
MPAKTHSSPRPKRKAGGKADRAPGKKQRPSRGRKPAARHRAPAAGKRTAKAWWRSWLEKKWSQLQSLARREPETVWFAVVLAAAALLRLLQPDWYFNRQFHPDERWIIGVVSQLSYPQEPVGLQYGTFPMYCLALLKDFVALLASWFGPFDANRFTIAAGRVLSAAFDLGTLVFTYLLGRRLLPDDQGRKLGLLAAAFLAFTVLNIQMAHFFVVDVPLGFLVMGTLYWSAGIVQKRRRRDYVLTGVFLGLALATKTSAAPLIAAVGLAHLIGLNRARPGERLRMWQDLGLAVAASLTAFFVAMPHAVLNWQKFWLNQNEQRRILVTGLADVPYNRQYLHTLPYLYYFKNLIQYTMGFPLGVLSAAALIAYPVLGAAKTLRLVFGKRLAKTWEWIQGTAGWWIILGFAVPYFLVVGTSFAKFNRYLLPLTPVFCLLSAHALLFLRNRITWAWGRKTVSAAAALTMGITVLWSLAFVSIYQRQHPWIAASRWIQEQLPAVVEGPDGRPRPAAILNEEWGDDLPTHVPGMHPKPFRINKFPVQEPDTPRKREIILQMLPANDLIVMADTRAHAVYRRLPDRYPINAAYYELMFEEKLGYRLAAEFSNYPGLFGVAFPDDRADESFTLYDHPHVYLFRRTTPMPDPSELARRLDARIAEIKARVTVPPPQLAPPTQARAQGTPLPTVINANIGQDKGRPVFILGRVNSFSAAVTWILMIEIIGLLAIPLCLSLFPRLPDSGVALAKIIGTLILAWTVWLLVSAGVLKHLQSTTFLVLVVLGAVSVAWALRRRMEIEEFVAQRGKLWLTGEIVFLVAFVGYLLTKMYNPDINNPFGQGYNGGGEPMGISFFSAVYNSLHFPPYDPWLSGYHINYYYYGQVILGILAKLAGVPPNWSYQICISLLFALTFTGVYGLGLGLTGKRRWGLAAAVAAAMLGNLHTIFYMLEPFSRSMNWSEILASAGRIWADTWRHIGRFEFIWNPTRLIKGTINEMPWFSFLYGDLHAHIIAIPYSLPLIGWGLNILLPANAKTQLLPEAPGRTGTERGLTFFVTALTLGALSAINTWNFPPYAILVLGVLVVRALRENKSRTPPWRDLGIALLAWLRLVVGGLLLLFFFHKYFTPQSTTIAFVNPAVRTHLKELLQFFGLFMFLFSTYAALALVPAAGRFLTGLGWKPASRKPWWDKTVLAVQTMWARHPLAVYFLLSGLVVMLLLAAFNQLPLVVLGLMLLAAVYFLGWRPLTPQLSLTMLLVIVSLGIVLGCELVHVRDFMGVGGDMSRMNTVFKFYMVAWIYLALVSAVLLAQLFSGKKEEVRQWLRLIRGPAWWRIPAAAAGVLLAWTAAFYFQEQGGGPWLSLALAATILALPWIFALWPGEESVRQWWAGALSAVILAVALYPPIAVYNRMRLCSQFKQPTLDGNAYLRHMLPQEAKALAWISANIKNLDVILEAPGYRGYNCFDTRIAIFTGHPSLIGWIGQEEQMRYNNELTSSRTRDAELIYKTMDWQQARQLLERYQVEYVFVGENERKAYPGPGLQKFSQFMDLVYDQDQVRIYQRRRK